MCAYKSNIRNWLGLSGRPFQRLSFYLFPFPFFTIYLLIRWFYQLLNHDRLRLSQSNISCFHEIERNPPLPGSDPVAVFVTISLGSYKFFLFLLVLKVVFHKLVGGIVALRTASVRCENCEFHLRPKTRGLFLRELPLFTQMNLYGM